METKIVISQLFNQVQVGLVEGGRLAEYYIQRDDDQRAVGNIYKGRVENVLPGMNAAFVELGSGKNGFLHLEDIPQARPGQSIAEVLRKGQPLLVQVQKEQIGSKGPRMTGKITLPGRFLVLLPQETHLGVSRQIVDPEERERLSRLAEELKPPDMGLIVRTVAVGCDADLLAEDLRYLLEEWHHIMDRFHKVKAPALLYHSSLVNRVLRDLVTENVSEIIVDGPELYRTVVDGLATLSKQPGVRVQLYEGKVGLFEHLGLARQLEMAQQKRVGLDCGGYLVIDETEALVSIDVNTGKYVGTGDLGETFLKTNLEAAEEIAWQLRLRNIGGIIIVDFIDMEDPQARDQVLARLEAALSRDKTKTHVLGFTSLGLLEMTRKKTKRILSEVLQTPCPLCEGTGKVQSVETVAARIMAEVFSLAAEPEVEAILVKCDPAVASHLIGPSGSSLEELEGAVGKAVYVRGTPSLSWGDFQVVSGKAARIAAQAYPVAVGDRIAARIEHVHASNPRSGIARVDGFVIDCLNGAEYVGKIVNLEITDVLKTYATARVIKV